MIILAKNCLTDDEFLTRFADAAAKFMDMGLCNAEVKKMLANLEWVQDWVLQPKMIDYAAKLPKGYKWSQGERLGKVKGGKINSNYHVSAKPGVGFLEVGDDLYIRDLCGAYKTNPDGSIWHDPEAGYREYGPAIGVIRGWRKYLAFDVLNEIERCWRNTSNWDSGFPSNVADAFLGYWKKHGGHLNKIYISEDYGFRVFKLKGRNATQQQEVQSHDH